MKNKTNERKTSKIIGIETRIAMIALGSGIFTRELGASVNQIANENYEAAVAYGLLSVAGLAVSMYNAYATARDYKK